MLEGCRREVKVVFSTAGAAIDNPDIHRPALIVDAEVATAGALAVIERVGDGDDELAVGVGLSTGAEADFVVGYGAGEGGSSGVWFGGSSGRGDGEAKRRNDGDNGNHVEVFEIGSVCLEVK